MVLSQRRSVSPGKIYLPKNIKNTMFDFVFGV
jgi:hypothetical protein